MISLKSRRTGWVCLAFCVLWAPRRDVDAADVDVYLLGGQSNMQGIGQLASIADQVPTTIPHCYFFVDGGFHPLILGVTKTSTRAGEFGPEVGLALELATEERPVYLIKSHFSGMPLHHGWDGGAWKGGDPVAGRRNFYPGTSEADPAQGVLYRQMLARFQAGLDALEERGDSPKVRGFVWMQGEADAKNGVSATEYAVSLRFLRDRLAEDLSLAPALPTVFGQVLPHEPASARFTHRVVIREQMARADEHSGDALAIPRARMVSTDGVSLLPDTVHYDGPGQLDLGRRFGRTLKALIRGLGDPEAPVVP